MINDYGKWLKICRENMNYSQDEIAARLHIRRQTLSNYENGKRTPPPETLFRLSSLYHVSIEQLIGKEAMLSASETELLRSFRSMSNSEQNILLDYLSYRYQKYTK